jgi:hypothetical protein
MLVKIAIRPSICDDTRILQAIRQEAFWKPVAFLKQLISSCFAAISGAVSCIP